MNYQQIIELALSYSDRTDSDITNRMGDFVDIVEARLNRSLRVGQMATQTLVVPEDDQTVFGLPVNYGGMRSISVQSKDGTGNTTAEYVTPDQMNLVENAGTAVSGLFYTMLANEIQIYPPQNDKVLSVIYYKRLDGINDVEDTNWISDRYPDCYVFGLLVEIESFVKNPAGADLWNQRFQAAVGEIEQEDQLDRWSGTPLTIRAV